MDSRKVEKQNILLLISTVKNDKQQQSEQQEMKKKNPHKISIFFSNNKLIRRFIDY